MEIPRLLPILCEAPRTISKKFIKLPRKVLLITFSWPSEQSDSCGRKKRCYRQIKKQAVNDLRMNFGIFSFWKSEAKASSISLVSEAKKKKHLLVLLCWYAEIFTQTARALIVAGSFRRIACGLPWSEW